ncbi:aminotransferase class IV [Halomonadaceae bacterium KBTZ08]
MPEWIWPGDSPSIPVDDRGLAYAQGVFETLRVGPSGPVLLEAHRERLLAGCRALGIPFDTVAFDTWTRQAAEQGLLEPEAPAVLKIMVTAGSGGRGYRPPEVVQPRVITTVAPVPAVPREGVSIRLCQHPLPSRVAARGCKTLGRLEQVLASAELAGSDFEGLMGLEGESGWVEGTRTCLFSVMNGTLVTPSRERLVVAGTLRDWLVRNAPRLGLEVTERNLMMADFQEHGLVLGNSVMGLVPVSDCNGERVPVSSGAGALIQGVNQELGFA